MSIRFRVAAVFTLALALAFALGSWIFLSQLRTQLLRTTDANLRATLAGAGQYLPSGRRTPPPAIRAGNPGSGETVVQVIDPAGQVRGASQDAPTVSMLTAAELARARSGPVALNATVDEEQLRVYAAPMTAPQGWVAVAGVSVDTVSQTLSTETTALIIGSTVFVVLGGLGAYWLAAAALSPVERMRREVAALSERDAQVQLRVPRTRDELARLAGTMNDLLARLHGALARQRGFVADASHELRTPLAVLGAELELASRPGRSREDLAQAVAGAGDEVARLTRITNDLLVLARSDEGRLPVRPQRTPVRSLLDRSAEAAAPRARGAGAGCVVRAPDDLLARLDPDRIRQAVDNLIDNALRFAPAGSTVTVSARAAGPDLVIEVTDAGPGFPAEFLPHAFERFRRPDTGRARSEGGAGLGLAIVAAIAVAHGGTVAARNAGDGGAVVTIVLPGAVDAGASTSI
ncbi:MAG: ATP-binding protein [Actinomycetota bacterium]|nr:ATP-binding protein [Actinomycetota bacterium]